VHNINEFCNKNGYLKNYLPSFLLIICPIKNKKIRFAIKLKKYNYNILNRYYKLIR